MDQFLIDAKAFAAANEYPKHVFLAFSSQYIRARKRGVAWEFDIREWWDWWQTDDRWSNRGNGRDKFVMARFNDLGSYHPKNVYCATHAQNGADTKGSPKRKASAMAFWNKRRADGRSLFGSRVASIDSPERLSISLPEPQMAWLRAEAASLGLTVGELLRRIIDRARRVEP